MLFAYNAYTSADRTAIADIADGWLHYTFSLLNYIYSSILCQLREYMRPYCMGLATCFSLQSCVGQGVLRMPPRKLPDAVDEIKVAHTLRIF
jgi:hypothetical protein